MTKKHKIRPHQREILDFRINQIEQDIREKNVKPGRRLPRDNDYRYATGKFLMKATKNSLFPTSPTVYKCAQCGAVIGRQLKFCSNNRLCARIYRQQKKKHFIVSS